MTKITHIDRATMRIIDKALQAKLDELGDELGLAIKITGGNYSTMSYLPKLEIKLMDQATGQAKVDPYFIQFCTMSGVDPDIISSDGYRIVEYKTSRPKFPWLVEHIATKRLLKAPNAWVKARFKPGMGVKTIASQINSQPQNPPSQTPAPKTGQHTRNYQSQF